MNRYQFEDLISAYIENELSLSKRKEVESYLAENPHEDKLVNQISLNIQTLKNSPKVTTKENFNKRLLKRIKKWSGGYGGLVAGGSAQPIPEPRTHTLGSLESLIEDP